MWFRLLASPEFNALIWIILLVQTASASEIVGGPAAGSESPTCSIDSLPVYLERGRAKWLPAAWDYSFEDHIIWHLRESAGALADVRCHPGVPTDSVPYALFSGDWGTGLGCTNMIWTRFFVGPDTLSFTMGRAPEYCSEAPRIVWTSPDSGKSEYPLNPLFNWNVGALWCTPHYWVFGCEALYEGGGGDACLGIWRLATGDLEQALQQDAYSDVPVEVSLFRDYPKWREAEIAEVAGKLVFRCGGKTLILWPESHEVALVVDSVTTETRGD